MDLPREPSTNYRRYVYIGLAVVVLPTAALAVARLEPAAPEVDRAALWTDAVQRGEMVREIRGPGVLVPERIRLVTATTPGLVERVLVAAGAIVDAETPLLELSNPEIEQQAAQAERELAAHESEMVIQRAQLEMEQLNQASALAALEFEHREAERQASIDEELLASRIVSPAAAQRSRERERELARRVELEESRIEVRARSMEAQLRVMESQAQRIRESTRLARERVDALTVRAEIPGVVQAISAEEGQWVTGQVARVVDPSALKAVLRIPEVQVRDVVIGQQATIDTRAGVVVGAVTRIDPAAVEGSVTVDVRLEGELPSAARPDLNVDGLIQLDRLDDVLHLARPVGADADRMFSLFRVDPGGGSASRIQVRVGRVSASRVEIAEGLAQGDEIILSDMSRWSEFDRVRLR